jgi:adenylate kinase family enzyme
LFARATSAGGATGVKLASLKIAVVSTSSGAGKTTLARRLAALHHLPHVELDSLHHLANWEPAPDFESKVAAALQAPGWIVDGNYHGRLGDIVTDGADLVIWLDLPMRVCLWRLTRRTARRWVTREVLWNGNRETLYAAVLARDSLFRFALSTYRRRREEMPGRLRGRPVIHLRSQREVDTWLANLKPAATLTP